MLSLAATQTTTLNVPFIAWDNDTQIMASVISAAPSATTLSLACAPGTDGSDCGMFPTQILTYGPSIYRMEMADPNTDAFTMTQDCKLGSSTIICTESASGSEANFPGQSTETYGGSDFVEATTLPVTVTSGAEKLAAATGAPASSSAGSAGSSSSQAPSTGGSAGSSMAMQTQSQTQSHASVSPSASASGNGTAPAKSPGAAPQGAIVSGGLVAAAIGVLGLFL